MRAFHMVLSALLVMAGHLLPDEAFHAERVLGAVVEAPPLLGMDESGLHGFRRRQTPDLPPDFSSRHSSDSTRPRSTALTMS